MVCLAFFQLVINKCIAIIITSSIYLQSNPIDLRYMFIGQY